MQQLKVEHKKTANNNQKIVEKDQVEEYENKREANGRTLALRFNVFMIQDSDMFLVESESVKDLFYSVSYKFDDSGCTCNCPDSSIRNVKCKHYFAVKHAFQLQTLALIDRIPVNAQIFANKIPVVQQSKSWKDADYGY